MATAVNVSATNNAEIDGLLSGYKWSGTITYSFPDAASDYASSYSGGSGEPTKSGFASAPSQMQAAINYAIGLIVGYTNAGIQYAGTNGADIMVAQSPAANPTSYAYYPGNYAAGGDVWFGTAYNYSQAALGNYYFTTALHELGHALGLKHSQETGGPASVAVPSAHDDSEYTVMSYRSYVGASTTSGYTNEAYGYPQTYMANDILALQTMYGANYTTQGGTTVYTWSATTGQEFINGLGQPADNGGAGGSANRIYETIWDGGGVDTYDLSNYTTNLSINLNPGASSVFSSVQLANLGNGHYASGNVYNAYLYNSDARSYIDNATGGSGNDTIVGNAIANVLNGGGGNDTITGGAGNDTIIGGAGMDTVVFSGNLANYAGAYDANSQTFTLSDQRSGSPNGTDTVSGVEYFQFADSNISSLTLTGLISPVIIEAAGTTSLGKAGSSYSLKPMAGSIGLLLKYEGAPVVSGQFSPWAPIGAEPISGGYEVAFKNTSTGQYVIWNTDANGNQTSSAGPYLATDTALQQAEVSFHQDLNGDGTLGVVSSQVGTTIVESLGTTSLVQVASNYYLDPLAGGSGPSLKYSGATVVAGQFGTWMPIGAEPISGGYEVAFTNTSTSQYVIWNTDANGNQTSSTGPYIATDTALQQAEASFHQDLNGDGTVGVISSQAPTTVVESLGATSLMQVASNYYLDPLTGGSGPSLKYSGSTVVAGQFGAWMPIGAERISGGFEIAFRNTSTGQFVIWNADADGNQTSSAGPYVATDTALQQAEVGFHQDLNGDGTIGAPSSQASTTIIESMGATSLVQIESNYYLNAVGGSGQSLKYSGSTVVAGQFGTWMPIGGEHISGGYEVAFKNASTGQYVIWNTDSDGNQMSSAGPYAATSTGLDQAETGFQQDLNGDGIIGAASAGSSAAEPSGDALVFRPAPSFSPESKNSSNPKDLHATLYSDLVQYEWTDHSLPVTEHPHLSDPLHGFLL